MAVSEANLQRELPYRLQSSSARSLRRDGKPGTCRRRWLISTTTSRRASRNCVFRSAIAGRSAPPICWNGCSVRSPAAPKACPREGGGHPACLWRACGHEADVCRAHSRRRTLARHPDHRVRAASTQGNPRGDRQRLRRAQCAGSRRAPIAFIQKPADLTERIRVRRHCIPQPCIEGIFCTVVDYLIP